MEGLLDDLDIPQAARELRTADVSDALASKRLPGSALGAVRSCGKLMDALQLFPCRTVVLGLSTAEVA